ncbi:hypothetical protein DL96DRAFT_1636896 [Flagelloscypha sp. PMI_526]|nr:hypothetical protein DL96DRAFT_1636896 [Flagelloscypha sp. PMI_526]
MVVISECISAKQSVNEYESYSDMTILLELQDCTYSLAFGPVLILSAIALQHLRKPRSSAPSYSVKRLRTIILAQMIFITLRFACRTVQKVFKDTRYFVTDDESIQKLTYVSLINVELGLGVVAMLSARAVELLASAVLVWRACAIYPDLFWLHRGLGVRYEFRQG